MTNEDVTPRELQPPAPYAVEEAQRIEAGKARLNAARSNIPVMRRNADLAHEQLTKMLNDLQAETDLAERYANELPYRAQALELLCKENHWVPPTPTPEQPAPQSTEAAAAAFLSGAPPTQRNPIVRYAAPGPQRADGGVFCGQPDCDAELIHENGVWRHTATGNAECEPIAERPRPSTAFGGALTDALAKVQRPAA